MRWRWARHCGPLDTVWALRPSAVTRHRTPRRIACAALNAAIRAARQPPRSDRCLRGQHGRQRSVSLSSTCRKRVASTTMDISAPMPPVAMFPTCSDAFGAAFAFPSKCFRGYHPSRENIDPAVAEATWATYRWKMSTMSVVLIWLQVGQSTPVPTNCIRRSNCRCQDGHRRRAQLRESLGWGT